MSLRWEDADYAFPAAGLDCFLLWAAECGASDVSFQTGAPAFIEVDGILRRATGAILDGVAIGQAGARGSSTIPARASCAPAVPSTAPMPWHPESAQFRRFRCNLSPVLAGHRFGINITMRVLPDNAADSFADLGIEPEIAAAWELCRGLTLVTGVPGSGKSTLLAAGTRRLLESGAGRVQSYEAPIEFVFDGIAVDGALMSSSEVPRHFPSFAEGLRASLQPAACGRDRGRGAGPGDGGGGDPGGRLRHRGVRDRPHHRRRRRHPAPAGGVPCGGAPRAGRCPHRRDDAGGDPDAAAEPGAAAAPPSVSGSRFDGVLKAALHGGAAGDAGRG